MTNIFKITIIVLSTFLFKNFVSAAQVILTLTDFEYESGECIKGDCVNGEGVMHYIRGTKYEGSFKNGKPNGKGKETIIKHSAVGGGFNKKLENIGVVTVFEGNFKNGIRNGYGIETINYFGETKKIRKAKYKPFPKNSIEGHTPYGKVIDIYPTGVISERKYKNGRMVNRWGCKGGNCVNGEGVYYFPNGDEYHGQFKNQKMHGEGMLIKSYPHSFDNRDTFHIGEFRDGKIEGNGTYYTYDKKVYGNWKNDWVVGYRVEIVETRIGIEITKGDLNGKYEKTNYNGVTHSIERDKNGKLIEFKYASERDRKLGEMSFAIFEKKQECEQIGFKPKTDKFADCVLRLVELDLKKQSEQKIVIAQNRGSIDLANFLKEQNNLRFSQTLMQLGQQLMSPKRYNSNIYMPQTRRCTIQGFGSFANMICR
jgi:hypothetical protein